MSKFRRLGLDTASLKRFFSLLVPGSWRSSRLLSKGRATRLALAAGDGHGLDQLEQRQMLFTLTITPDLINPATGLGTIVSAPFAYFLPTLRLPLPDPQGPGDVLNENFDDEMDPWTAVVPPVPPSGTTFLGSEITLTYTGPTPQPVVLGRRGGGTGQQDQFLRVTLNGNDQATFGLFNPSQGNGNRTPRVTTNASFTIENGPDGDALKAIMTGTRVELLRGTAVVQTLSGAQLAAIAVPVAGATRYDLNFAPGFDGIRFRSAQDAPANAGYADSFNITFIDATFPSTRFAAIVDAHVFGAVISFTGPVGATLQTFDVYGDDMRLTLRGRTPQGGQIPEIDANGDGIPDYNDGIGRIVTNGTNQNSSFIITGGTISPLDATLANDEIAGDGGWKLTVAPPAGLFADFQQQGFGFVVTPDGMGVLGLPPGPGSVIVGSPYVRNRTNSNTYYGIAPAINGASANLANQGVFINGPIGQFRVDGAVFGTSGGNAAIERIQFGALFGSLRIEGDVGQLFIAGDAGLWFNPIPAGQNGNNNPIQPTSSRVFIGRTVREISIGGRNSMDIEVLGDVNNPARPTLNFRDFFSAEVIFNNLVGVQNGGGATVINSLNQTDFNGRFTGQGTGVILGNTWLRDDTIAGSQFIGYNGTSVRITGALGGTDPVNTGVDFSDVYAFAADPTREVVISAVDVGGLFGLARSFLARYVRVVDRDGRVIAATDAGAAGRGAGGQRGGDQVIRFRPEIADTYYIVVEGPGAGQYSVQVDGMAPVTMGMLRVAASAGAVTNNGFIPASNSQGSGGFTLAVGAGGVGQVRVGAGFVNGAGVDANSAGAVIVTNQPPKPLFALGGATLNVAGNLHSIYVGSDIRGTQIAVGGDIGVITTGHVPLNILNGDLYAADIRVGGRIALLDIKGGVAIEQLVAPQVDRRDGLVTIQTGQNPDLRGDIGQILVGAYIFGPGMSVITSNGSIINQFIVGVNNGGAGSENPGFIEASQPLFRMGAGSDIRFVDFTGIMRPGDANVISTLNYGQTLQFTDDAGAQYTVSLEGGTTLADGTQPFLTSTAQLRILPIDGSQGVAMSRITATLNGGANLVFRGISGGVVSIGNLIVNSPGVNNGQGPGTPIIDSSIIFEGNATNTSFDIGQITHTGGVLREIRNSSPNGDIVAIDAQSLTTLTLTGSLGRTQVGAAGWGSALLGPRLGLGDRQGAQGAGSALGVANTSTAAGGWDGNAIFAPVPAEHDDTFAFIGMPALEFFGSPIDDTLNGVVVRVGDLTTVTIGGQVGDVLVEAGDLINLVVNSDGTRVNGVFEGIVGSVYAVNIGTIDIGDGLIGTGAGPFAQAGIFADGNIFQILGTRLPGARINGVILAAGTQGVINSVGAGAVQTFEAIQGIQDITITDGIFDGAFIGAQQLDDFWQGIIFDRVRTRFDPSVQNGEIRRITGTRTDLFRSFVGGSLIGTITLNNGAFDATEVNSTSSIGTISAREFRNTTRLGQTGEFLSSLISTSTDLANITATPGNDITDLNLDIGGSLTGTISARNIIRSTFAINLGINAINASNDIRGVQVVAGSLRTFTAGQNIRSSTLTVAGPIQTVSAIAGEITQLDIDSTGPDGRLESLTAPGRIQGRINSSGQIGTIRSTNADIQADILTRQEPGRPVPGLTLLQAGGSYIGGMIILGDVGTIRVGRNIAERGQINPVLDIRGNLATLDAANGNVYADLLVGQSITGTVMIGRVGMLPGNNQVSTSGITAFGRINSVVITGDYAGDIVSRSAGIGTITITEGSLLPTGSIVVSDGSLTNLTIRGGDLLGDVLVDGDIGNIDILVGASGFKGQIGIASFRRNTRRSADPLRNELPPAVVKTAGVDGVVIQAGGSIGRIFVERGSVWESRIIAGTFIENINVVLQFRNDSLTTGLNNQVVAGERIGTVIIGKFTGAVGVVAGVRNLGADNSLGGTGADTDTVGLGTIGDVRFNGPRVVNSIVSAGIAPDSTGTYNTSSSKTVGGRSAINNVFANRTVNVSAFTDGALGTTSAGIVRGGSGLAPLETSKIVNSGSAGEIAVAPGTNFNAVTGLGQNFTLNFTGPGQVFYRVVGTTTRIRLLNTDASTNLIVSAANNGNLSNFSIVGNSGAALGALTVNASIVGNSTIYLDTGINTATFAGLVGTTGAIGSGGNINSLTFSSVNRAAVEAATLATLTVNGNFGAPNMPASLTVLRLSNATITGDLVGSISSERTISSFTAGAIRGGGLRSGDAIQSVVVGSLFQGRVSARNALPSVTVNGDANESSILAGADLGTDAEFGGAGSAADSVSNGTIGTLRVTGNFRKSDVGAGVLRGESGFLGNSDTRTAAGRSSINSIIIVGSQVGSSVNSEQFRIMSTGTVGTVTVAGQPFTGTSNFRTQTVGAVAVPVRVTDLSVLESSRIYTAVITFNQQVDQSTLASALSINELRSSGAVSIGLALNTDYTITFDNTKLQARVQFSRNVTARNLPLSSNPGPGVYQFRLNASVFRGSTQDTLLDGNKDGAAGDDWVQNTIVGDAGDKITAGNPGTVPTVDFFGAADLDLVLRTDPLVGTVAQPNTFFTVRGSVGDHPDTDPDLFRSGGDADVYRITLRAGQILRMSEMRGVAQQASRGVFDAAGNFLAGTFGNTAVPGIAGIDSGAQVGALGVGLRRLPSAINVDIPVTAEDQYLVTQTGTYFIVIAGLVSQFNIADVNDVPNLNPVPGAFGAYDFDIMVFDDQNSGFLGDSASGTGAGVAYAPAPSAFFGPDNVEGTSDDITQFNVGDWTFVRTTENGRPIVRGTNSQGWVSIRRPATNNPAGSVNDELAVNINSSIGLPDSFGKPTEIAPDLDIFRLNNGQPITPGTRIRATLRLTSTGADIGVAPEQAQRTSLAQQTIVAQNLLPTVQFALFELPAGTAFDNARLVGAASDFLPVGAQPQSTTTDGRISYGYDASGDFFMDFIVPGAQTISGSVPAVYALYLQGSIRSDYTLEIVQQGVVSASVAAPTRQNVLLETLGGMIGWLEAGNNVNTDIDPFDLSVLGFSGQFDGLSVNEFVLNRVITKINAIFTAANADVVVSSNAADFARQDFSTVFLAGNVEPNAFFNNGTFGASQHRDFMNADKNDQAVVFLSSLGSLGLSPTRAGADQLVDALTAAVTRRIGELIGLSLEESVGLAQTNFPIMGYDAVTQGSNGTTTFQFNASDRALAHFDDFTTTTVWFLGSQNAAGLLNKLVAPRVIV